jgi:hypothetical protein
MDSSRWRGSALAVVTVAVLRAGRAFSHHRSRPRFSPAIFVPARRDNCVPHTVAGKRRHRLATGLTATGPKRAVTLCKIRYTVIIMRDVPS